MHTFVLTFGMVLPGDIRSVSLRLLLQGSVAPGQNQLPYTRGTPCKIGAYFAFLSGSSFLPTPPLLYGATWSAVAP
eukprot:685681-Rhodomonas_salina.2